MLSTQKISKPTFSDFSLDSLHNILGQPTKDRLSCTSSMYHVENSIEEEILKDISTNLASKLGGLKSLFAEMEVKLSNIEKKNNLSP